MLEATIIIVDNSEPARNGDYLPTRYDAQSDAVHLLFQAKTSANPESAVGLMSSAGTSPQVLTTLTNNDGSIHFGLTSTKVGGKARVATALSIASLALKHRQNKSQHPRVVIFSCSPVTESKEQMAALGRKLKKGGLAVDVVVMGEGALEGEPAEDEDQGNAGEGQSREGESEKKEEPSTRAKWTAFHRAIRAPQDAEYQSHLAVIPPGPSLLSDSLLSTDVMAGTGMQGGGGGGGAGGEGGESGGGGGGDFGDFGGIDPNADPELALALRMSMEEEERRQAQRRRDEQGGEGTALETVPEGEEAKGGDGEKKDESKKDGEGGGEGGASGSGTGERMDTS
ncbi:MAG: hypothetical protein Q9162_002859 [Coniocarpon cinnabarinum]